jgi:hypothetical protein
MSWKIRPPHRGPAKMVFKSDDGTSVTIETDETGRFTPPAGVTLPLSVFAHREYAARPSWLRRVWTALAG